MNIKKITTICSMGAVLASATVFAADATPATTPVVAPAAATAPATTDLWGFLPNVLATIDGKDITKAEFVKTIEPQLMGADGKLNPMITPDLLKQVIPSQVKAYVDQILLTDAAKSAGFASSEKLVKDALNEQIKSIPKEQLDMIKMQLQAQNKTIESYIDEMAKNPQVQEQLAIQEYVKSLSEKAPKITDAEAKAYYEKNIDQMKQPGDPEGSMRASHILVKFPSDKPTDAEKSAALAEAKEILAKVNAKPETFAEIAQESSACPSKAQGGSLGAFSKGQMVPEFETATLALKEGEVSKEPVETTFGYHIIRRDAGVKEKALAFDDVKEQIMAQLQNEQLEKMITDMIAKLYKEKKVELKVEIPAAPVMPTM